MLIIDKDSVSSIRQKLDDLSRKQEVVDDVAKMLEIKQALLWRSEAIAPCCGSLCSIASQLNREVNLLENTLAALGGGDTAQAADLLEEYLHLLGESCESGQPDYCQS